MKIIVNKKVSNAEYIFEFDYPNEKEAIYQATTFANMPDICDECGNTGEEGFKLESNKDKDGNIYVNVVCNKCDAQAKLGTHRSGKSYFWHKFQVYTKNSK